MLPSKGTHATCSMRSTSFEGDKVSSATLLASEELVAVGASVVTTVSVVAEVNTTTTFSAGFHTNGTLGDSVGALETATSTCPVASEGTHSRVAFSRGGPHKQ